jgi:phosphatidylglycerol lysyltransferase
MVFKSSSAFSRQIQARLEAWGVRLVAVLTGLMGFVNLLSGLTPAFRNRLRLIEQLFPLEVARGGRLTSILAGFALILVAGNLARRKRIAWIATLLLLAVSVIAHLIKGLDVEEASLAILLMVLLVLLRRSFHADSDPPSLRQGLIVLAAAFFFTLLYGAAGFYLLDHHFRVHYGLLAALQQTVVMFTSFYNPGIEPITGFGRYFAFSIYVVGLATFSYALIMLIRPVLVRQPATEGDRARAAAIVQRYGRTSLARLALFEDKSFFFSPGGSVIAYAARGRGVLTLGDPIGPVEDVQGAISTFLEKCRRNDWQCSFFILQPDALPVYRAAGLSLLCIGYEAVIPLRSFSLEGSQNKTIRNAYHKLNRLGYQARIYQPPLDRHLLHELRQVSDAWLTERQGGEKYFFVGRFEDAYIGSSAVMVVRDPDGQPIAFANLLSEYLKNELAIDLMRHYPQMENGTMEFLFVSLMQWARSQGYDSFNLGLSTVFGKGRQEDDPRVARALQSIGMTFNRLYKFKGLHAFKEKFHPHWEPRYLAYPGTIGLPLTAATLLRVYSGENILRLYLRGLPFSMVWIKRHRTAEPPAGQG